MMQTLAYQGPFGTTVLYWSDGCFGFDMKHVREVEDLQVECVERGEVIPTSLCLTKESYERIKAEGETQMKEMAEAREAAIQAAWTVDEFISAAVDLGGDIDPGDLREWATRRGIE